VWKIKLILLFLIFGISLASAGEEGKSKKKFPKLSIGAHFSIFLDEDTFTDYSFFDSDIKFDFDVLSRFSCALELEADRFGVDVDEISFKWKPSDYAKLLLGKFENHLTLDEYISMHKRIFSTKNIISETMDSEGYISSGLGISVYRKYKKNTLPISYYFTIMFMTTQIEIQYDIGFFYHFRGKNTFLGLQACYFPFMIHKLYTGSGHKSQNFTFDFIVADNKNRLIYGFETGMGSNLYNPVGIGHTDSSLFWGTDTYIGYEFVFNRIHWIPALRYSFLFPEINKMECYEMRIIFGNHIKFTDCVMLHLDGGVGIITRYALGDLYTKLKGIYSFKFIVKI